VGAPNKVDLEVSDVWQSRGCKRDNEARLLLNGEDGDIKFLERITCQILELTAKVTVLEAVIDLYRSYLIIFGANVASDPFHARSLVLLPCQSLRQLRGYCRKSKKVNSESTTMEERA
jgi:hypothetical protein